MHDGKTLFDRGRSTAVLVRHIEAFVSILDAVLEDEKKEIIATLKEMEDDSMLEAVRASIQALRIDDHRLDSILSYSLRRNPA